MKKRVAGVGLLMVGLLAGCTTAGTSPSSPVSPGASQTAPASVAPSSASPIPSSSFAAEATPPKLSPEAQMETDRLLILAAKANDPARVRELIAAGGNVNAKDGIQDSAFLYAGAEGFNEVLQLTLAAGADVRSINRYGGTALIPASEHGHTETVRILIAAGVPVDHVNNLGWTAMQEAILLNNGGPNQQDVVRQLLEAGANPDIRDPQGRTALQNAERLGFTEIAGLIRG
ncbi:ankyrin repeat domain-containing protein [Paenarthrobacter sp. AR 02]|uniref:ankyrin repeat domain-containing protein n=1 Tax=Paenarthrobacter sp. AR 02 TaxID=2899821 RepID=UPI001F1D1917|nr:ankyrin repeat domain-containing protein [Paenarthrobacter sp. AR 02]MCF3139710.1 ankyrin repeat domain-containing protein [Paenarthrobacter sp. AR 02]